MHFGLAPSKQRHLAVLFCVLLATVSLLARSLLAVCAVTDHNSQFGVVPEPGSIAPLAGAAAAALGFRRRPSHRQALRFPKPVDATPIGRNTGRNPSDDNTVASSCYAAKGGNAPRQDRPGSNASAALLFGCPHTSAFCRGFPNGAVRWIRYQIAPGVHQSLSNRSDGAVIPGDAFR